MYIIVNVYVFVGLVLLAIVGGLFVGAAVGLIAFFMREMHQNDREQKKVQ